MINKFKKKLKFIVALSFIISIVGCNNSGGDAQQYEEANKLVEKGKYKQAKEIYNNIKSYKDSENRITDCDFLITLGKSVIERMNASDDENYSVLVDTELSYLEDFTYKDFGNKKIEKAYKNYSKGLNIQKGSLNKDNLYSSDYAWQQGKVKRFEVLSDLYNEYNFLKNNKTFVANYIKKLDYNKNLLEAYNEIFMDISSQLVDGDLSWNYGDDYMETTIKNNSNYTYDITFYVTYTNDNNTILSKDSYSETEIKNGMSYTIHLNAPIDDCNYEWEYQIDDVLID